MMDVEDAAYCRDLELIYAKLGVYTLQADLVITKHIIPVLEMETEQITQVFWNTCNMRNLHVN